VNVNGGGGRDLLVTHILANADSGGRVLARERGGPADDDLILTVRQQLGLGAVLTNVTQVSAQINGGVGVDHCERTPNVTALNCESDVLDAVFGPDGEFAPPFLPPGVNRPAGLVTLV
jgi:hypothetical protein